MGVRSVHKFGRRTGATTGDDLWIVGGAYSFPASAAATTVLSSSSLDAGGSSGALTVRVEGLDSNWLNMSEDVTLNGTNAVTLTGQYLRVNRAFVLTVGANEKNIGNIDVKHGVTVLARIPADKGQTEQAIYTTPADFTSWDLIGWDASVVTKADVGATLYIERRTDGGAWRTIDIQGVTPDNSLHVDYKWPIDIPPKTDIRITVESIAGAGGNPDVSGGFDLFADAGG